MEPKLLEAFDNSMPRFNDKIIEGFHRSQFDDSARIYEQGLKQILKHLPKKGVRFSHLEIVQPREFMTYLSNANLRVCDVHKETVYPVKLIFEWFEDDEWVPFKPLYQMLSYTNDYGDIHIRNSFYNLKYVLSDRGLPVTKEHSIFIKILGYKFKVTTEAFRYAQVFNNKGVIRTNSQDINISANRFYSPNQTRRIDGKSKIPRPLLSWYIFGNEGFSSAMERWSECEYELGSVDAITEECRSEDGWTVMKGYGGQLQKFLGRVVDNDFAVAIRNKNKSRKEISPMGVQYAVSLLYVSEHLSTYFDLSRLDDPNYWRLIIGRCSVKSNDTDDYILKLMGEHFESMGELDVRRLRQQGVNCSDMWDLLNYISVNRSEIVQTSDRGNMVGKELTSLEHSLDVLLTSANGFNHDIKNTSDLTKRKVERALPNHFRLKTIDSTTRSNMDLINTPTDCPLAEHALAVISQDRVNPPRGTKSKDFDPSDTANLIHPSLPFINSYLRITEPNPDGRGYLNPCLYLENDKVTAIRPDLYAVYEEIEQRLKNHQRATHDNNTK